MLINKMLFYILILKRNFIKTPTESLELIRVLLLMLMINELYKNETIKLKWQTYILFMIEYKALINHNLFLSEDDYQRIVFPTTSQNWTGRRTDSTSIRNGRNFDGILNVAFQNLSYDHYYSIFRVYCVFPLYTYYFRSCS